MMMKQRTRQGDRRPGNRGAALIMAIAIMTILLAIALTFYAVSRVEVDNANNVHNRVQADLYIDAALAMAIAELNRDFLKHPNATSNDFKPFALFNGSWASGKQWALRNGIPLQQGGVPLVDLTAMPVVEFADGTTEPLYSGSRTQDWLYYPRIEGAFPYAYADVLDAVSGNPYPNIYNVNDRNRPPFVTPAFYGAGDLNANFVPDALEGFAQTPQLYPLEWIHTWTDVDNDNDGLRDSIWIPLPRDLFFSGGELDRFGNPTGDDYVDNDLDGFVDEAPDNGRDDDGDGTADFGPAGPDPEEQEIELGTFVYHGLGYPDENGVRRGDGLDNDGVNGVDDPGEDKLFLTAPLPGLVIPVDLNGDGIVPDLVLNTAGELEPLRIELPGTITVPVRDAAGNLSTVTVTAADVDVIDNDLDMLVNDFQVYAYYIHATGDPIEFRDTGVPDGAGGTYIETVLAPSPGDARIARYKQYVPINPGAFAGGINVLPAVPSPSDYNFILNNLTVTHSGEPVCELAGRAAILVRDEAGKMNMNEAGAHRYDLAVNDIVRSLGQGAEPSEVDTRVLPDVGVARAANLWGPRTGAPLGDPVDWDASIGTNYFSDVLYPGYGRVDDNANTLVSAFNGRDDNGDGLIDEGVYLPTISLAAQRYLEGTSLPTDNVVAAQAEIIATRYLDYYARLGLFEGVDEPGERKRYQADLNLQAENRNPYNISGPTDTVDNDNDGALNERGELGDLQLQDTRQIMDAFDIGPVTYGHMAQSVSVFSADRNTNFTGGRLGIRGVNKLDYNFATPAQIAGNMLLSNPIESFTARVPDPLIQSFAEGLRQNDIHTRSSVVGGLMGAGVPANGITYFPADPVLQTMQAAVDIVDNRDANHSRSSLQSERRKATPQTTLESTLFDPWPATLGVRERIAPDSYFPLGEIEDHLRDTMGVSRKLTIRDDWWMFYSSPSNPNGGVIGERGDPAIPEERHISYAVSGNEAIKINELMVRPVRRVEAEAVPDPGAIDPGDTLSPFPYAVNFDPTPFGNPSDGTADILPSFNVARQTGPGWGIVRDSLAPTLGLDTSLVVDPAAIPAPSVNSAIVEFTINTSSGLPPGRYYLTVNSSFNNGATVIQSTEMPYGVELLQSAVKYRHRTLGGQPGASIIEDVANGVDNFQTILDPQIGGAVPGAPRDWFFVDGTRTGAGNAELYHLDGLPADAVPIPPIPSSQPTPGVETFTVYVPPAGSSYELRIAFRLNPAIVPLIVAAGDTRTIHINALDFSQEPDHEWVELVNTSDETVNIGGWELEVGIPDTDSVPPDPFKSTWRIPPGTEVAPRGMVLLAFNKFDQFQDSAPANHRIADNGMGLADGTAPVPTLNGMLTGNLTVPPIGDTSPLILPATSPLFDMTGSVFRRITNPNSGALTDYLDTDGDGRTSLYTGDAADNIANDTGVASSKELGTFLTNADGNLPWDRIIQLDETSRVTSDNPFTAAPSAKRLQDIGDLNDVSALVLRGGVLPNYPEQDHIDNDGDGGYLQWVAGVPQYVPGILDRDMVDNNFNGFIDERGILDPVGPVLATVSPQTSEGVDEGAGGLYDPTLSGRQWGAGSYEPNTLSLLFFNDRSEYPDDVDYGANFGANPWLTQNPADGPAGTQGSTALDAALAGIPITPLNAAYTGSNADPLDWMVFAERRWYPGDNVIVTLYEGNAINKQVVDRVTYREYDVRNRTIDDLVQVTIDAVANPGDPFDGDGDDLVWSINPLYPTIWEPDHMGLDFYRSLERKHPLYNGDRFGTTNRWEATDGNYDDWADSLSYFEAELLTDTPAAGTTPLRFSANTIVDGRARFLNHPTFPTPRTPEMLARSNQLDSHAIAGTPLRANSTARRADGYVDLELEAETFVADYRDFSFDYFRTHEDGDFDPADPTPTLRDQRWNLTRAAVENRPYQSPADLMRVPHVTYLHDAINTGDPANGFLRDMTMLNYGLQGDSGPADGLSYKQDVALRGATFGQDPIDDSAGLLAVAANSMATDTKVLTAGQAELRPILPTATVVGGSNLVQWVDNPASGNPDDLLAPGVWAPVFLFPLPDDGPRIDDTLYPNFPWYVNETNAGEEMPLHYLFDADYIFNTGNFGGNNPYNNVNLDERWPLEKRTVMYVSENRGPAPPESLFIWDGDDGLENGEYTLYIGTFIPQMRERLEEAAKMSAAVVDNSFNFNGTPVNVVAKNEAGLLYNDSATVTTLVLDDGRTLPIDVVTKSLITRDPTNPRAVGQVYDPIYAIDVITDPSEARGEAPASSAAADPTRKPGGLIHPNDWNPPVQYTAGPDGYIAYGNIAAGGWKPQTIRITDNFLAIRIRNVGAQGQVGALTHVVLAPQKRTAGRMNLNTADTRIATVREPFTTNDSHQFFSSILGVPGVVDVGQTIQPGGAAFTLAGPMPPAADVDLMGNLTLPAFDATLARAPWTPPGGPPYSPAIAFYGDSVPPTRNRYSESTGTDSDLLVPDSITGLPAHTVGAFRFYAMITGGRTEHADGRYYDSVGDLALDASGFDYAYAEGRADRPDLTGQVMDGVDDFAVYPLSNESDPVKRYDEVRARLGRMGSTATVRSDVFEITATVESGYGIDRDGDGFINYRDPDEFVTTAQTKASAIYERRTPSGLTDGQQ